MLFYFRVTVIQPSIKDTRRQGLRAEINTERKYADTKLLAKYTVPFHRNFCSLITASSFSNAKNINIFFHIKYTKAILSNSTRKLLWFEISKTLTAVKK